MRVFLSHIGEEQKLALVLKDWIESSFPDMVDVFVSSDIRDLAAGDRWLQEIDAALEESQAFIVLCSPESVSRPWINFETGSAWIKRVPVIPICHSGQEKSTLPSPLSVFQALETSAADFVDDLFASMGKHLSLSKVPRIDSQAMKSDIAAAIGMIPDAEPSQLPEAVPAGSLDEATVEVLHRLADRGDRGATLNELAAEIGLKTAKMEYHLDELLSLRFISRTTALLTAPSRYRLRPEGRRFLVDQGLL